MKKQIKSSIQLSTLNLATQVGIPPTAGPIFLFLQMDLNTGMVTGLVEVTNGFAGYDIPPSVTLTVSGTCIVSKKYSTIQINLSGTYSQPCKPPALCILDYKFTAMIIGSYPTTSGEDNWGDGNFTFGNSPVYNFSVETLLNT